MADENQVEENQPKVGLVPKIIAGVVVGAVVLIESVVAYMMTPDPDAIAAQVRNEFKVASQEGKEDADLTEDEDVGPLTEVELGQFDVAIHDASADATYHVSCNVAATIAESDMEDFNELLENNQHRLRERIMIEFRSATAAELNAAGLDLIKRRILEKSNSLLGKPLVRKVMFPDYNYYVQ